MGLALILSRLVLAPLVVGPMAMVDLAPICRVTTVQIHRLMAVQPSVAALVGH